MDYKVNFPIFLLKNQKIVTHENWKEVKCCMIEFFIKIIYLFQMQLARLKPIIEN